MNYNIINNRGIGMTYDRYGYYRLSDNVMSSYLTDYPCKHCVSITFKSSAVLPLINHARYCHHVGKKIWGTQPSHSCEVKLLAVCLIFWEMVM